MDKGVLEMYGSTQSSIGGTATPGESASSTGNTHAPASIIDRVMSTWPLEHRG
jgi:hypothetical protein